MILAASAELMLLIQWVFWRRASAGCASIAVCIALNCASELQARLLHDVADIANDTGRAHCDGLADVCSLSRVDHGGSAEQRALGCWLLRPLTRSHEK